MGVGNLMAAGFLAGAVAAAPVSSPPLRITLDVPTSASRPSPAVRNSIYDGATQSRRAASWRSTIVRPNAYLDALTTLRNRSRQAVRNDGYAKGAIDRLVTNIVGTGMTMRSKAVDKSFAKQVDDLWGAWCEVCDADGLLDWDGLTTQAVRAWLEGGESFVRLRPRLASDGLPVPLQLQVLEPELCPHNYSFYSETTKVRAGIEFNAIGQKVAYWFYPSRPELDDYDMSQYRRVPAEALVHLFDPLRPGQLRGLPHLTQALLRLYELDKYDDATLLRQQLANMFVGFVKTQADIGDTQINPMTGQESDADSVTGKPLVSLEPGIVQELDPGTEMQWSDPPDAGGTYEVFMRQQLFATAAATGVPYELLTGDMSRVNDRTVRVLLHEFRRRVMAMQHQIVGHQLCRKTWSAWFDQAIVSGALPLPAGYAAAIKAKASLAAWEAVEWAPHGWPYLHPVQDITASRDAIRAGFTTRSAVVAETGESSEAIDREQLEDNERADALGLRYSSDGRQADTVTGKQAEPLPPGETGELVPAGATA